MDAPFSQPGSRYAVFELYAECARCILVSAHGGTIVIENVVVAEAPVRFSSDGYKRATEELLTKMRIPDDAQLIILFDRNEAVIMQTGLSMQRADWSAEITMPELDNAIRHGVWQVFQQERSGAGKLLHAADLKLRLSDVDVVALRLDGHRVVNPIGFRAQTIDVVLRQTFVRSEPWVQLVSLLPSERIIAVIERSGFWAGCAALIAKTEGIFLDIGEHQTFIFKLHDGAITFSDSVSWGTAGMFSNITAPLGLPTTMAPTLIGKYAGGLVSSHVGAHIEDALKQEFAVLLHTIEAHRAKRSVPVFVHSIVSLPPLLSHDKLMRKLGAAPYTTLSEKSVNGAAHPVVHYESGVERGGLTPSYDTALALVIRASSATVEALATKTAKQRARWISSVN